MCARFTMKAGPPGDKDGHPIPGGTVHRVCRPSFVALVLVLALAPFAPRALASAESALAAEWKLAWTVYHFGQRLPLLPLQRRVARTLTIEVAAPIDHVFEVWSEIDNHVGRHPYARAQDTHQEYERDGVHTRHYTTTEQVPVLFGLPVTIHTHAQQRTRADAYTYETDTWTAPNIVYHGVARFTDLGNGRTRVTEELVFQANVLLIDFTVTNGVSSHEAGMRAFKTDIESGAL
jgi:hypothetical protein